MPVPPTQRIHVNILDPDKAHQFTLIAHQMRCSKSALGQMIITEWLAAHRSAQSHSR